MGLKDTASLALIPAAYKTSKIYSAIPTDGDGDFTFTRSGNATRINKAGLVETMGTNIGRLNYNLTNGTPASCPHLLLEPSRTNSITYSEDFSNGIYNKNNATVTVNNTTAPDGTTNADKITSTGTAPYARVTFTHSTLTTYTVSIFAKKGDENYLYIRALALSNQPIASFNLNTGALGTVNSGLTAEMQAYSNGWYRCIIKYTTASSISNNLIDFGFASSNNSRFSSSGKFTYFWGSQIEAGSYTTSYIPTPTVGTRVADFCNIPSGLGNVLNTSEGTLFVDVEVPRVSSTGSYERIVLSDQNSSTDRIIFDNYGGNWRALVLSTGGTVANYNIRSVQANTRIKVAFAYSSTELRISYDGNTATTTSGSYTPTTTLESFKFSNKDGGNKWQGKIYQAMYFNTALTNAELKTLTS